MLKLSTSAMPGYITVYNIGTDKIPEIITSQSEYKRLI